jgi:hypothetical protein
MRRPVILSQVQKVPDSRAGSCSAVTFGRARPLLQSILPSSAAMSPYQEWFLGIACLASVAFGQATETLNENLGDLTPHYQIGGLRSGQLMITILF